MKSMEKIFERVFEDHVASARFAPDGRTLAFGRQSDLVSIHDANDFRILNEFKAGTVGVHSLEYSPDSQWIAIGGENGVLTLISVFDENCRYSFQLIEDQKALSRWIDFLIWSPDSEKVMAACGNELVFIDREQKKIIDRRDCGAVISSLSLLPDGKNLLAARAGGIWFLSISGEESDSFMPVPGVALKATSSPTARYINVGLLESSVAIWDRETEEPLIMRGYERKVSEMDWTPASGRYQNLLFAAGGGRDVTLWDFSDGPPDGKKPLFLTGHRAKVNDLHFMKKSPWLLSAGHDGELRVWQGSRQWKPGITLQLDRPLLQIEVSPKEDKLLLLGDKGHAWVYQM
jgi:WD40 repeat protein